MLFISPAYYHISKLQVVNMSVSTSFEDNLLCNVLLSYLEKNDTHPTEVHYLDLWIIPAALHLNMYYSLSMYKNNAISYLRVWKVRG